MSKLTDAISELAEPIVQKNGCELWDVEYVKEAGVWYLRVYIDCDGGVNIAQCEAISREMDPLLDELDPIEGNYTFEVSSAGAERVLKRPRDFLKFIGSQVELKLYKAVDAQKVFIGTLKAYGDNKITLECAEKEYVFNCADTANVRLRITF